MALECATPVEFCALRVTRLNDDGTPAAAPNNVYVVNDVVQLQVTANVREGEEHEMPGGCGGCIIASKTDEDQFRRYDLELQVGRKEPGLEEMLLGTAVIQDTTDLIGGHFPSKRACGTPAPRVAIEGWAKRWLDTDEQDTVYPWVRYLWVSTAWVPGQTTLQSDFGPQIYTGKSRANSAWDVGPYGDQPEAAISHGMWWFDAGDLPAASCDYSDVVVAT